jgi:hypothetical protein
MSVQFLAQRPDVDPEQLRGSAPVLSCELESARNGCGLDLSEIETLTRQQRARRLNGLTIER